MLWQRVCGMVHRHFPVITGTQLAKIVPLFSFLRSDRTATLAEQTWTPTSISSYLTTPTRRRDAITKQPCRQHRGHSSQHTILPIVFDRHSQRYVSLDSHFAFSASLLVVSPSFRFFATNLLHRVSVVLVSMLVSFLISASLYFPPTCSFPMVQTDFYS